MVLILFNILNSINIAHADHGVNELFFKALYNKNYPDMEELIKNGADVNAPDKMGMLTPLAVAAGNGDLELVNFLLRKGASLNEDQEVPYLPLYLAIASNHSDIVLLFMNLGVSPNYAWPNENGGTLLITAVQFGHINTVELLTMLGADVNFCGNSKYSPLYRAIIYDHYMVFKFLLSKGAILNKNDMIALAELNWWGKKDNKQFEDLLAQKGIRP